MFFSFSKSHLAYWYNATRIEKKKIGKCHSNKVKAFSLRGNVCCARLKYPKFSSNAIKLLPCLMCFIKHLGVEMENTFAGGACGLAELGNRRRCSWRRLKQTKNSRFWNFLKFFWSFSVWIWILPNSANFLRNLLSFLGKSAFPLPVAPFTPSASALHAPCDITARRRLLWRHCRQLAAT